MAAAGVDGPAIEEEDAVAGGEEGDAAVVVPSDGKWPEGARVLLAPATGLSEGARVAEAGR